MTLRSLESLFVLRSDDLPADHCFSGYFFDGSDLYQGTEGAEAYLNTHGTMPRDRDGIYVSIEVNENKIRVGSDYAGIVPLFFYQASNFWAVSPSFDRLLDLAQSRGDTTTVVPEVLQAWRITGAIGQFPQTSQTCIEEITVVPTWCNVVGGNTSARLEPRVREFGTDYGSTLDRFRRETACRFHTIVRSGENLLLDVTGGIDSRAILALAWEAFGEEEFRSLTDSGKIELRSNPSHAVDFDIAHRLADVHEFQISGDARKSRQSNSNSERNKTPSREEILDYWRAQRLGRWAVPGLNESNNRPDGFWSSGVFGGSFKSPNALEETVPDGRKFLRRFRKKFNDEAQFKAWRERIISDQKKAQKHTGGERLPFWPIFNREVVMRMHAGQYLGSRRLYPLSFKLLNDAANFLDAEALQENRIHHDLIHAGMPMAFDVPYDKPEKEASLGFEATVLTPLSSIQQGTKYGRNPGAQISRNDHVNWSSWSRPDLINALCEEALSLIEDPRISAVIGDPHVEKYKDFLDEILKKKSTRFFELAHLHLPHLLKRLSETTDLESCIAQRIPETENKDESSGVSCKQEG